MRDDDLIEIAARTAFSHEQCDRRQAALLKENWNQRLSDEDRAEYRALASAILANVEPIIRADERKAMRAEGWVPPGTHSNVIEVERADERERIAQAIEAMRPDGWRPDTDEPLIYQIEAARLARQGGQE